jgi:antitoxin (DNA-binding transcriptional repressor) of toxin-antitoxin stability system
MHVRERTIAVMSSMSISEARANLPEILTRVERGEEVTITRHGRAAAVLVRPDVLRARRAQPVLAEAEQLRDLLATARSRPLPASTLDEDRAEELIREIRAGREGR